MSLNCWFTQLVQLLIYSWSSFCGWDNEDDNRSYIYIYIFLFWAVQSCGTGSLAVEQRTMQSYSYICFIWSTISQLRLIITLLGISNWQVQTLKLSNSQLAYVRQLPNVIKAKPVAICISTRYLITISVLHSTAYFQNIWCWSQEFETLSSLWRMECRLDGFWFPGQTRVDFDSVPDLWHGISRDNGTCLLDSLKMPQIEGIYDFLKFSN